MAVTADEIVRALHSGLPTARHGSLVLLGTATTGPVGIPVTCTSLAELERVFRDDVLEPCALAAGDTTYTLALPPRALPTIYRRDASALVDETIPGLALGDGAALTFLPFGRGQDATYPLVASYTAAAHHTALRATARACNALNAWPLTCVRLNGTHATAEIAASAEDVLVLVARDGGPEGNLIEARLYATRLGAVLEVRRTDMQTARIYELQHYTTLDALAVDINTMAQVYAGDVCAVVRGDGTVAPTLGYGMGDDGDGMIRCALSGGTHGLDASAAPDPTTWNALASQAIAELDVQEYTAIHIPLMAQDDVEADSVSNVLDPAIEALMRYPSDDTLVPLLVISVDPGETTATITALAEELRTEADAHAHAVVLAAGTVTMTASGDRCTVGALIAAAFTASRGTRALTGVVLPIAATLDQELSLFTKRSLWASHVHTLSTRRTALLIDHDYSLAMSGTLEALYVFAAAHALVADIRQAVSPYLGKTFADLPDIDILITSAIDATPAIKEASYHYTSWQAEGVLEIWLDLVFYGEITFRVAVYC